MTCGIRTSCGPNAPAQKTFQTFMGEMEDIYGLIIPYDYRRGSAYWKELPPSQAICDRCMGEWAEYYLEKRLEAEIEGNLK